MIQKTVLLLLLTMSLKASNVVIDSETGMMWQDTPNSVKKDYSGAKAYCRELSLGGHSDWKLPNIDELMSISDKNRVVEPAIKVIFKNTKNSYYWSSSEYVNDSSQAWLVYFSYGADNYNLKSGKTSVRCVRVGQ